MQSSAATPKKIDESTVLNVLKDPSLLMNIEGSQKIQATETKLQDLLLASPMSALASIMQQCMTTINLCDPGRIIQNKGWVSRFVKDDLTALVTYQYSTQALDHKLKEALHLAEKTKAVLGITDELVQNITEYSAQMESNLILANVIISDHPHKMSAAELGALRRRKANIETILHANAMNIQQFKLHKSNAIVRLQRIDEVCSVVAANWRSLQLQKDMTAEFTSEKAEKAKAVFEKVKNDLAEINALLN